MIRMALIAGLACAGTALAAQAGGTFTYAPMTPRWQAAPDDDVLCAAVRRECAAQMHGDTIGGEFYYDALYDARGFLVGIRVTHPTGCAPLDESLLLSERHRMSMFSSAGRPDLAEVRLEGPPGTSLDGIRMVKGEQSGMQLGCPT
jgi:hypothetical protein